MRLTLPTTPAAAAGRKRAAADLALVLAMVACVVAISAHAPSTTTAYAQLQQIGAVVGTIETGNWLLPRDHTGGLARKGQLYAWVDAPILMLTGIYNDFTFRLPTVASSFVAAVMIYLLGRRWYGRRAGLLAACMWASIHHMAKLMYVALTDMMVAALILASIFCADRLLFHPAARRRRKWWVLGLWATMILGGLSKGRGLLNVGVVGLMLAPAVALWPGFAAAGRARGYAGKAVVVVRLAGRRWWRAMKATAFLPGMAVTAGVLLAVWLAMLAEGGQEFRKIVDYEIWARITGSGPRAPHPKSVPTIVNLLYYMLPVTVFAAGAMVLAGPRRWLSRKSPLLLPLCWLVSVVLPFSLTHAARHDYLLPCYAGGALMGAWAVEEIARRAAAGRADRTASGVRHAMAAAAIVISALLMLAPAAMLFCEHLPRKLARYLSPAIVAPETWWVLAFLIPAGVAGLWTAVAASLKWRVRTVSAVVIVGMLGVMFVERHAIARQARTGDGERLLRFAMAAREKIGADRFAKFRIGKLGTELYIGRFGTAVAPARPVAGDDVKAAARSALANLKAADVPWLITCDKGLVELGAAEPAVEASYRLKVAGKKVRFRTAAGLLGAVEIQSEPVISQRWGRAYLIRLDRAKLADCLAGEIYARAVLPDFASGRQEED